MDHGISKEFRATAKAAFAFLLVRVATAESDTRTCFN